MKRKLKCNCTLIGVLFVIFYQFGEVNSESENSELAKGNELNNDCPKAESLSHSNKESQNNEQLPESLQKANEKRIQTLENTIQNLHLELQHLKDVINRKETKSEDEYSFFDRGRKLSSYQSVPFLNYQDRKRILITGGAGFLGSHLTDRLMLQGHEVVVADNFFTGRKRSLEHWIGHPNFELLNHDMINPLFIEVDEIYHLASPASPPHYMFNPVKTIKTNTAGTINMLGLAKRVKAKILIASTSEVYGDPEVHPQPETYWGHVNPIGPRACYDEGKRVAETLAYAYEKQESVQVRVARIFNTYGPRMHMNDGRVVSNFILQALKGMFQASIRGENNFIVENICIG